MKTLIRLGVSLALLFLLFWKVDTSSLASILREANAPLIALAVIPFFVSLLLEGVNLLVLVRPLAKIGSWELIRATWYAWAIGLLLPGRIGDLAVMPFLKKKGVGLGPGLGAVIANKAISVAVTLLIAAAGSILLFRGEYLLELTLLMVLGIMGMLMLLSGKMRGWARKWILRKYGSHFIGFYKSLKGYATVRLSASLANAGITVVKILVTGMIPFLLFRSVGEQVPFFLIVIIFSLASLLSLVPVTLSGLGLRESATVVLLAAKGISPPATLVVLALHLALTYGIGLVLTLIPLPEGVERGRGSAV